MKQNRARLVQAALTIIGAWIDAGRPAFSGKSLGSFEHYCETMGGILQHAGVEGFLTAREQMTQQTSPIEDEWSVLVRAWAQADSGAPRKVKALVELANELELIALTGDKSLSVAATFVAILPLSTRRLSVVGRLLVLTRAGLRYGSRCWLPRVAIVCRRGRGVYRAAGSIGFAGAYL
jgi:hypothetical protein